MGFLYHLAKGTSPAVLSDRLGSTPATREILSGPFGPGLLVGLDARELDLDPDRQEWRQEIGEPGIQVGYWRERLPSPSELRRPVALRTGYDLLLGDGRLWDLPSAYVMHEGAQTSTLPQARDWTDDGVMIRKVQKAWRPLAEIGDEVWRSWEVGEPLSAEREVEIALTALAALYRIGRTEVAMLGLLDDLGMAAIFRALVSADTWPSYQQLLEEATHV